MRTITRRQSSPVFAGASLIIPAAGLGTRFSQSLRTTPGSSSLGRSKLLHQLGGEPVLLKTLRAFRGIPEIGEIILAISPEMRQEIMALCKLLKDRRMKWVIGAKTRAGSVLNALKKTSPKSEWVLVHDGARPLIAQADIRKVIRSCKGWDGVILARKVVPTIKRVLCSDGHIEETVDRSSLYEAETPQMIRRDILLKAYQTNPKALDATDEASLLEAMGARVRVVPHTGWNPKLTTVTDLVLAEAMMKKCESSNCMSFPHVFSGNPDWIPDLPAGRQIKPFPPDSVGGSVQRLVADGDDKPERSVPAIRIGIGFDTHRLVPGRKLWLGGVSVPSPKGSLGHSDGDALLHAIADAMLGVIGAGDIGEWFSDKDRRWKNMKSRVIVETILAESKKRGWAPYHVDSNIILQAPKLGPHKMKIRKMIAGLLALPVADISVKARTREGLGPEGEGLAVTCQAIVAMKRQNNQ